MIRSPISILQTRLKSVSKQSCTLLVSFPVQIFAEVCYRSRRNSHVFAFCRSTTDAGHNWLVFMSWYKFVPFSFMFALTALAWQPVQRVHKRQSIWMLSSQRLFPARHCLTKQGLRLGGIGLATRIACAQTLVYLDARLPASFFLLPLSHEASRCIRSL